MKKEIRKNGNARISAIIQNVCKKLKITYQSPYVEHIIQYEKDKEKLAKIYYNIKVMIGDLIEIEEHYPHLKELKAMLDETIELLDIIDHDIKKEAYKLKKEME